MKLEDIITPLQKGNSAEMHVDVLATSYIRNDRGKLVRTDLPPEAQLAPVFGIVVEDFDNDSKLDLVLGGNLSATQPDFGPYDASIGLLVSGDGNGNWRSVDPMHSGLVMSGEVRDIKIVIGKGNEKIVLVSRNNQSIMGFRMMKR